MAFPTDVLGTTSFKVWRESFNTVKNSVPERIESASADPAATDDDYGVGSIWIRLDTNLAWVLVHTTVSNDAVWLQLGAVSSIVGITGTMAEFDTAVTDGNFAYDGGAFHDGFSDHVANEHIDWTNASDNFDTSGTLTSSIIYAEGGIRRSVTNGSLQLLGANGNQGANLLLYGHTHASKPSGIDFSTSTTTQLDFVLANSEWDFQANAITTTGSISSTEFNSTGSWVTSGDITFSPTSHLSLRLSSTTANFQDNTIQTTGPLLCGALTSNGIDDNASGERLELEDTEVTLGTTGVDNDFSISKPDEFGLLRIMGGTLVGSSSGVEFYGTSHSSKAADITFFSNAAIPLAYDESASSWDFDDNLITTTGALNCGALTSVGLDDNCTSEMFEFWDHVFEYGDATATYVTFRTVNNASGVYISGGNSSNVGSNITLYGGATTTLANDIRFRASAATELYYDDTASTWDFQANGILTSGGLLVSGGDVTLNGDIISQFGISSTIISGGTSTTSGGNIHFYGDAEPDIDFFGASTLQLRYDDSASLWDFQANAITTTGLLNSSNMAEAAGSTTFSDEIIIDNAGLTTDDQFRLAAFNSTTPMLSFSTNDDIRFDRASNTYGFYINNVLDMLISQSAVTFEDEIIIDNAGLTTDDTFKIGAQGSTTPMIQWDTGDRIQFSRSSGVHAFYTGNVLQFSVQGAYVTSENQFYIKESSGDTTDRASYGQFWVEDNIPNEPRFTDDSGLITPLGRRLTPAPYHDHEVSGTTAIMQLGTGGATINDLLYMDTAGKLRKTVNTAIATMPVFAMCVEDGIADDFVLVLLRGFFRDDSYANGASIGKPFYAATSAGGITFTVPSTAGDVVQVCGTCTHADRLYFNPSPDWIEL